ncbi:MAG: glycosyltransferase family 2 protein [Verrucomicrobiales bacterium]
MEKVSIIIPCYNKARHVCEAVESALNQTYKNCEVIVVDDGSTDSALDVLGPYIEQITLIQQENQGGSAARNAGISSASGSWIQFLDADDRIEPSKIETQLNHLSKAPEDSVAACAWNYFNEDGSEEKATPRLFWKDYDLGFDLLVDTWSHGGFLPCHSWLLPRHLIDQSSLWNTELSADDDGEFIGRILIHANQVRFTRSVLAGYRTPSLDGVSQSISDESMLSVWEAWNLLSQAILEKERTQRTTLACLRRLRFICYSILNQRADLIEKASHWEARNNRFDLCPYIPFLSRWLIALLGTKNGLRFQKRLKGVYRK